MCDYETILLAVLDGGAELWLQQTQTSEWELRPLNGEKSFPPRPGEAPKDWARRLHSSCCSLFNTSEFPETDVRILYLQSNHDAAHALMATLTLVSRLQRLTFESLAPLAHRVDFSWNGRGYHRSSTSDAFSPTEGQVSSFSALTPAQLFPAASGPAVAKPTGNQGRSPLTTGSDQEKLDQWVRKAGE